MKAIVLCAGYGKRLYPLTSFIAKPLLPVCGKSVLNYIVEKLENIKEIDEIFITTNSKFNNQFEEWSKYHQNDFSKKINLFKNSYLFGEKKVGGVDAIDRIIRKHKIKEDVLIIAGDNLFEYSLKNALSSFRKLKKTILVLSKVGRKEKAKKFGVAQIDSSGKIINFIEKPKSPKSNLISTAIYFFARSDLNLIKKYNKSKHRGDSFGYFLKYLLKEKEVYGFLARGKFIDIGSLADYKRANRECAGW